VRFAFIQKDAPCAKNLIADFKISKYPTLVLKKDSKSSPITFKNKLRLEDMREFVNAYALSPEMAKEERIISSQRASVSN